ncbi:kappaPI-actitoxin-Avd3c-like [Centruroides vittatus]|uniref:kappaPI-actitoxin-Avd3c-like n=1 Tax=Centruroides vittatus TaxID=120091 RepID=UPI00350EB3F1
MKFLLLSFAVLVLLQLFSSSEGERCNLPADAGLCYAHMLRYYYDAGSGKCKDFIYGGCKGNTNRFLTKIECCNACGDSNCLL